MKKRICLFAIMILFLGFFVCTLSTNKVNALLALNGDVDLLICNPGEDASTQMRFSFHTNVSGVTVQIAKKSDGNFDNAIKISPECISYDEAYPFKGTSWGMNGGPGYDSTTMKICEAEVNNLIPDTEYMYRVGATNFSETRYFKTAGTDGTWGFLVMADPQTYVNDGLVSGINENMNRAMENAKKLGFTPELVVCAGDQVNDGGQMGYWRGLYGLTDIYKVMPLACVVGNHDCLDAASGKVTSGMYVTASMWNAPDNGPEGNFIEDVYWFKWNNVLFCMMDSEAGGESRMAPQTEWFKEVASTIDYQYLVVMYHQGQWGTTTPSPNRWYSTFEEYSIDLSFSGDNHDYGRGYKDYIGTPTVDKFGPFRGQANYPGHYVVVDDTRNASNAEASKGGYCIVKVTPSCIYYYAYDQYDIIRDQYVFTCQRPLTKDETFSKDEFEKSIKVEVDETNSKRAILSYGEGFIGNVGYMTILNESGAEVAKFFPNSTKINTYSFGGLTADTDYNYKLKIEYKDGTDKTIDIKFRTSINYGTYSNLELKELSSNYRLSFNPDDIKVKLLSKCLVYINGEKKDEYEPTAKFVALDKSLINDDVVIELRGVVKTDNSEVVIGKYSKNAPAVPELTVETTSLELTEGETGQIKASVTEGAKIEYASNDESIAKVDASGKVTAVKAGTTKVTIKVEGYDISKEVSITVKAKEVTPEPTPVITVETTKLELTEGETGQIKASVTEGATLEYASNDESVAKVDASGKVTAVKAGTAKITVKVSGKDISKEVTVTVKAKETTPDKPDEPTPPDEPVTPEPEPEPKSGCGAGAIQAVWSILTVLGLAFVFRRRKLM